MRKQIVSSSSGARGCRRGAFALLPAALLLLGCGVKHCPEGTHARFDQCVRLTDGDDAGAPDSPDAGVESGVDGGDGAEATTETDAGCDADRMWSGGRCVLKEVYVDAFDGDDANDGTVSRPFKTFKRAVGDAVAGQIVNFEAREYTTAGGDDFTPPIPHDVTLRTRPGSRTQALLVADGAQSLVFARSATLDTLQLSGFKSVMATSGEQRLTRTYVGELIESLSVSGDARMRCENCFIRGPEAARSQRTQPLVVVRDNAALTLMSGLTAGVSSEGTCVPANVELIRVVDAASLVLAGHHVSDDADRSIFLETQGSVALVSFHLRGFCDGANALVWRQPSGQATKATLELEDCTFGGGVTLIGSMRSLRVRRCEFRRSLAIQGATSGTYDLGLPVRTSIADVGWNTFAHLAVSGAGIVVSASGNKWQASLQGADEHGHYAPGETRRVSPGEGITGENFSLAGYGGSVELQF